MSIYKTAIDKPVTTALLFVAVIIIGIFALSKLPIDQYPEMEPPYVSVMCTYPGNSGSEIETNLTKLLENSLNSIEGLDEMTSTSKDNIALVTMKFQWGQNMDEVVNDVRSALDMLSDNLPDGAGKPIVFKFNTSMMPILMYAITADESYPGLDKILEENVTNVLNQYYIEKAWSANTATQTISENTKDNIYFFYNKGRQWNISLKLQF